jgi:hypothetical protein
VKKIKLEWLTQIPLGDGSRENLIYSVERSKLPDLPGVYVFGRLFGKNFEALYVGKAISIRSRLNSQFKNLPLMMHIKKSPRGTKVVLIGCHPPSPGTNPGRRIILAERALIRHFLAEGHDLVNKQGTRLRQHEIRSIGAARFIPAVMYLDKTRGEFGGH